MYWAILIFIYYFCDLMDKDSACWSNCCCCCCCGCDGGGGGSCGAIVGVTTAEGAGKRGATENNDDDTSIFIPSFIPSFWLSLDDFYKKRNQILEEQINLW